MLKPIRPGLRALRYDSKQVAKVQIYVRPGEVLHVSDDLAGEFQRADPHFKPVDDSDAAGIDVPAAGTEPAAKPTRRRRG